jgi:hypothetical protein
MCCPPHGRISGIYEPHELLLYIVLWRVSPVREQLKHGASNQARNRKGTSCYAKHATVERVATPRPPRSLLRNNSSDVF